MTDGPKNDNARRLHMTMIYALNRTTDNHLAAVTAQMEMLGAPTIRVVDCGDH